MLNTINHEQGLYVLKCGTGYSCLGFEVAERKRAAVAAWLGDSTPCAYMPGTAEHYAEYEHLMQQGALRSRMTGTRCNAELTPQLIGLEGRRVEVTTPSGDKSRFIVGRSTGWMPCHLEIKRRDSTGGGGVYLPEGSIVRVIR